MGFGILVIGYMFLLGLMPTYGYFISYAAVLPVAATVVVILALRKLSRYGKLFSLALYGAVGLFLIAVATAVTEYGRLLGWLPTAGESYGLVMFALKIIFSAYFNIMLLSAINRLASEVGSKKLAYTSKRNLYLQMVYYVLSVISIFPVTASFWGAFGMVIYLMGLVCFVLNLMTVYSAYMRITLE